MVVAFVVLDDSVPRPSIQFYLVHLTILVIFLIHLYGLHSSLNRWIQQNQKEHSDMSSECSSFVSLISFHSFLRWHFPSGNDASIRSPPSPGAPGRIFGCRFCFLATPIEKWGLKNAIFGGDPNFLFWTLIKV